ncbi:MAG TPA: class I SAM-dependent methyltransferase [Alphaproteobacteria bacterium]|nr:class I SAM-dependent methyltransferase [Alphaproteobacteria bacterium]
MAGTVAHLLGLRYLRAMEPGAPEKQANGAEDTTDFGFRRIRASEKSSLVRAVFDGVAGRYDLMNDLMSFGIHRLWKQALIDWLAPRPGMRLLDIAGGTGDVALRFLARASARSRGEPSQAIVCDVNEAMMRVGRERAIDRGVVRNLSWVCGSAENLPVAARSIDACTVAFGLRNVTDLPRALGEAHRVLAPCGRFICLEFSRVDTPILADLYERYSFSVVPALGRIVAGQEDAYRYLVESIRRFPDAPTLAARMREAGFARVGYRLLSGGIAALHSAWRI